MLYRIVNEKPALNAQHIITAPFLPSLPSTNLEKINIPIKPENY